MIISNTSDISLSLAVWLLHDEYDYINEPNYISVTGLMKPIRHIVLPKRIKDAQYESDVSDFIASALGKSIHDSIEKAWLKNPQHKLKLMGYPDALVDRLMINPTHEELQTKEHPIAVYLEQRMIVDFEGYKIGGKFDKVSEGILRDFKSTSAWSWVFGTRDEEHALQMSLYRWLDSFKEHPIITADYCEVDYIFTDWQKSQALSNPKYPKQRVMTKQLPLLTLKETEKYVRDKLRLIEKYMDVRETDLPECTDEELWRSDPKYKYYSNPLKTDGRATRALDTMPEAQAYMASKGGKGVIITIPGEVKRCGYCNAFDICTQKDQYQ